MYKLYEFDEGNIIVWEEVEIDGGEMRTSPTQEGMNIVFSILDPSP